MILRFERVTSCLHSIPFILASIPVSIPFRSYCITSCLHSIPFVSRFCITSCLHSIPFISRLMVSSGLHSIHVSIQQHFLSPFHSVHVLIPVPLCLTTLAVSVPFYSCLDSSTSLSHYTCRLHSILFQYHFVSLHLPSPFHSHYHFVSLHLLSPFHSIHVLIPVPLCLATLAVSVPFYSLPLHLLSPFHSIHYYYTCCLRSIPPPQVSYMISAWARMCKIIGQAFVQYLPVVMGPLLQAASIKPEIAIVDCELPWQCNK